MYEFYEPVVIPGTGEVVGTGWLPPLPDLRDYTESHEEIAAICKNLGLPKSKKPKAAPKTVDLRAWCSPIESQGNIGSCTAHAVVGMVEYFENRAFGNHIEGSRLFVYKATRDLLQKTGDTGAWVRNAMGALKLCGVPDEKYWPYTDAKPAFDKEPPAFVYSVANDYKAVKYFCHDPAGTNHTGATVLAGVKKYLAAGIPSMCGLWGFPSFSSSNVKGGIAFPCPGEKATFGHAVVAVGYDDGKKIQNTKCKKTTTGALLIRNSWGTAWGEKGYGWLPYHYVEHKLALDFWTLLKMDWVDTKEFGFGQKEVPTPGRAIVA